MPCEGHAESCLPSGVSKSRSGGGRDRRTSSGSTDGEGELTSCGAVTDIPERMKVEATCIGLSADESRRGSMSKHIFAPNLELKRW